MFLKGLKRNWKDTRYELLKLEVEMTNKKKKRSNNEIQAKCVTYF